jgi:hypothetical protein
MDSYCISKICFKILLGQVSPICNSDPLPFFLYGRMVPLFFYVMVSGIVTRFANNLQIIWISASHKQNAEFYISSRMMQVIQIKRCFVRMSLNLYLAFNFFLGKACEERT